MLADFILVGTVPFIWEINWCYDIILKSIKIPLFTYVLSGGIKEWNLFIYS